MAADVIDGKLQTKNPFFNYRNSYKIRNYYFIMEKEFPEDYNSNKTEDTKVYFRTEDCERGQWVEQDTKTKETRVIYVPIC